ACPPRTRFACRWDDGSCPRSNRKIPTAVRHRQHRTYNNRRPDFREQTQAAAEFSRRTFPPFPCLSPANRCDQSNAFSFCDSQSHSEAVQPRDRKDRRAFATESKLHDAPYLRPTVTYSATNRAKIGFSFCLVASGHNFRSVTSAVSNAE